MDKIRAVEVIETWQGEIFSGQRVVLVRFNGCNRKCPYCDTMDKIDNIIDGEFDLRDIQEVIDKRINIGLLVTGGETTFDKNLYYSSILLNGIKCKNKYVETNGYNLLNLYNSVKDENVKYVYSPKMFSDYDINEVFKTLEFAKLIKENLFVKIVYTDLSESYLYDIFEYSERRKIKVPNIYIMPEGKTKEEVFESSKKAFKLANEYKVNITTRLHIVHDFY